MTFTLGRESFGISLELVEEIIAFDVDSVPDQRLANTIAQRRARRWLGRIDEFFEPEEGDASSADGETSGGEEDATDGATE